MLGGGGVFVASKTMVPAPTPTPTRKPTPTVTAIPSPTPTATPSPKLVPLSKTPVKIQPPVTSAASPTPNPNAEFGFDLSTRSMQIQVKKGTCAQAFTFTSKGSTSWSIQSFDTWGGGHPIYWDKLNGGASNGETIAMQVCAKPDAQSYPGWGSNTNGINFTDNTSGKSVNLQVSYQISE
jgi:hypothetical protein